MFDRLRIKQAMPDGYQSDDWYRTKSMECLLVDYEVDEAGQLWELGVSELPNKEGKQALSYTGGIHFYRDDRQYDALFDRGNLLLIRVRPNIELPIGEYSASAPWNAFLSDMEENAVDTGTGDLADQHDHYLYGTPKRS